METKEIYVTNNSHDVDTLKQLRQFIEGGVGNCMRITITHDSSWKTFPERKGIILIENEEEHNSYSDKYTMLWSTYRLMLAMPNNYS